MEYDMYNMVLEAELYKYIHTIVSQGYDFGTRWGCSNDLN